MSEINGSSKSRIGAILKKRGWAPLLFGLLFFKGIHGIPQAFHLLFKIGKQDIRSYDAEYSGYFLWQAQSGVYSIIAFLLLIWSIYSIISDFRKSSVNKSVPYKNQAGEQGSAHQSTTAP